MFKTLIAVEYIIGIFFNNEIYLMVNATFATKISHNSPLS